MSMYIRVRIRSVPWDIFVHLCVDENKFFDYKTGLDLSKFFTAKNYPLYGISVWSMRQKRC